MTNSIYETDRLILRRWKDADRIPFALMNADLKVMEYFSSIRTRQESEKIIVWANAQIEENGFSFWAVERKDTERFIGFVGISRCSLDLPFCPCVEIGWRLSYEHWGQGFATEAARKSLEVGFNLFALPEIVSFTPLDNQRSRNVMSKIGMIDSQEDFNHPSESIESNLQAHCLYKITKDQWLSKLRS